jgi:hypothetical protein
MIASSHVYVLNNKKTNTKYGFILHDKSYVVGFANFKLSNLMRKTVNIKYPLNIKDNSNEKVYLSKLEIPIIKNKYQIFCNQKVCINDFMEYPNNNNIGIIYIMDISDEKKTSIIFDGLVIDPLNDIESYRKNLQIYI